jgi:hypothetical protein
VKKRLANFLLVAAIAGAPLAASADYAVNSAGAGSSWSVSGTTGMGQIGMQKGYKNPSCCGSAGTGADPINKSYGPGSEANFGSTEGTTTEGAGMNGT